MYLPAVPSVFFFVPNMYLGIIQTTPNPSAYFASEAFTMNKAPFRFKQFSVSQNKCAMKVNTDGVILGTWQDVTEAAHILDIGTGTGVLALMMAQKNPTAQIHAIDIDTDAYLQANLNFEASPWSNRLTAFQTSLQNFDTTRRDAMPRVSALGRPHYTLDATHRVSTTTEYDLIISNPPYFIDDQKTESHQKNIAKHSIALTYPDLLNGISRLLVENGKALIVLPAFNFPIFQTEAALHKLFVTALTEVIAVAGKPPYLVLVQLQRSMHPYSKTTLTIQDAAGNFTDEYKTLTKDFYLKF